MSKNNLIKKSDKKFIRLEKARIRRLVFDVKKQEEMIAELYKRFSPKTKQEVVNTEKPVEPKKPKPQAKDQNPKKVVKAGKGAKKREKVGAK